MEKPYYPYFFTPIISTFHSFSKFLSLLFPYFSVDGHLKACPYQSINNRTIIWSFWRFSLHVVMLTPVSSSVLYTRSRHYPVWRAHLYQWLCTGSVKRNTQTTDWTTVSMPLPWHRLLLWKISQSQWPLMVASQICRVYQRAHGKTFVW